MSSSASFFLLSLYLIILVSFLFTKAAAVRPVLDGRIHFLAPTNNPVYIPGIGHFIRSPGGNSVSSRSYIPGGDGLMLPRPWGSLGNNPIARSQRGNAVSFPSGDGLLLPRGSLGNNALMLSRPRGSMGNDGLMLPRPMGSLGNDGLMLPRPRVSLGNNPIARSQGRNAVSIPTGEGLMFPRGSLGNNGLMLPRPRGLLGNDGFMLPRPRVSLGNNPITRSPGGGNSVFTTDRSFFGNAFSSRSYMLHKRSLGYIPIVRDDKLAASFLPSPLPPSADVVESEPPSKPSPPSCLPRC